jgi:hypothetical protein
MDYLKIIAETVGFIASFVFFYSATRTNDKELIILQGVGNFLWIIHYVIFNSMTGIIACTFGVARNLFVFKWNSYKAKMGFVFVFGLFSIIQFFYIDHFIKAIPIIAIFIISYGILFAEKNKLTSYLLAGNSIFLIFAIYIESISATFNYITVIGLLLYRAYSIKKTDTKKVTE